jgi:hypothetical protein
MLEKVERLELEKGHEGQENTQRSKILLLVPNSTICINRGITLQKGR